MPATSSVEVGERVAVGEKRGSVRYIGAVDGYEGEWIGIEWDEPSRGKHDGLVRGKRYFRTSHPTGGSMVRPDVVLRGRDLLYEVADRYNADENVGQFCIGKKEIVFKLENVTSLTSRQKQLRTLRCICLRSALVSHAQPVKDDGPSFPFCTELGLYENLLHRWSDVMDCLQHTPNIVELVLWRNLLEHVTDESYLSNLPRCSTLRHLVLTECRLDEITIHCALSLFPNLEELYASWNALTAYLIPLGNSAANLTHIDLECNLIASFHDICQLRLLPRLEKLSLASCRLKRIELEEDVGFPALTTLNLKDNLIDEWQSITELARLPRLATLFIDCERFRAEFGLDAREVVIAKLPSLANLEKCILSVVERRSAELRFLNKYAAKKEEEIRAEGHEEDIKRLTQIHGPPVFDTMKKLQMVRLCFATADKTLPPRPLPTTLPVHKVEEMAKRLLGLNRIDQLFLEQNGFAIPLNNPMRLLSFYEPQNGDKIKVT